MRFFCGPRLLVIDEFAYARKHLDPDANTALRSDFATLPEIVDDHHLPHRYRRLGRAPRRPMLAAAVLDRLLHTGIVVFIDGPSYRMRAHQQRSAALRRALHPEAKP